MRARACVRITVGRVCACACVCVCVCVRACVRVCGSPSAGDAGSCCFMREVAKASRMAETVIIIVVVVVNSNKDNNC